MDKKDIFNKIISVTKIVAPAIITKEVYDKMFGHHINTFTPLYFYESDFTNLSKDRYTFYSHSKNQLVGYIYKDKNVKKPKGIFVFSHGYGGGGHHCYLDVINALCSFGYDVFAYDATGNDESEGKSLKGFTQGALDADRAISFVETLKPYQKLPLYLFGHSWGAYSASNAVGWHPRVKGLIAFSGFNQATSVFKANGELFAGEKADDFMGYVDAYEDLLFGDICRYSAVESFRNSKAKICVIHSDDDKTVPITAGFSIYKKEFKGNSRFKFIKLIGKGHGTVYYTIEGKNYHEKINKAYKRYVKKEKPNDEQKKAFLDNLIDRKKYNNLIDMKLMKKCLDFIAK